jgi:hypothetical protein
MLEKSGTVFFCDVISKKYQKNIKKNIKKQKILFVFSWNKFLWKIKKHFVKFDVFFILSRTFWLCFIHTVAVSPLFGDA